MSLDGQKPVAQLHQRQPFGLEAGGSASMKVIGLTLVFVQGCLALGVVGHFPEIVELALDLFGPPSAGMREQGEVGAGLGGLFCGRLESPCR